MVVYNGLDYYTPTTPKEVAAMTCDTTTMSTQLDDAIGLIKKVVGDLPPSTACDSLTKSLRFMGAAQSQLEWTSLATGTTLMANVTVKVPIPKPAASESVAKSVHKRAATMVGEAPPVKRANKSDEAFAKRKKKYTDNVTKVAKRDMKLGANQCPSSLSFNTFQELLNDQDNDHPDKNSWKCAHCPSVSNSKKHCWSHSRKHLRKFYFYCDVSYTGASKTVVCEKGFDEEIQVAFHRETHHSVRRCACRCDYCNKPQQSVRRKLKHQVICDKGHNKEGGPMHWCKEEDCRYSCRSDQSLQKHMKMDHHEALGLPMPMQWNCPQCGKEFKSSTGKKRHDCTTVKIRKPCKKKQTEPLVGNET